MALDRIVLQFSMSTAWVSGAIGLLTKSAFSHVDFVIPPGVKDLSALIPKSATYGLLGASDPGGVMVRGPNYHEFRTRRRMTIMTDKADAILARAGTQLGKPFDDLALKRTFDLNWGEDWRDPDKWYCIELVMWCFLEENFFDYRPNPVAIPLNHITPQDGINVFSGDYDPKEFANDYAD